MCINKRSGGLPFEKIPDKYNLAKVIMKKLPASELLKRLKEQNRQPENSGTLHEQQESEDNIT